MTTLDTLNTGAPDRDEVADAALAMYVWEAGALPAAPPDTRHDAITAAALTVIRRALVEGAPVTREALEREASVNLVASREEAIRELDDVAQRVGVSSLA